MYVPSRVLLRFLLQLCREKAALLTIQADRCNSIQSIRQYVKSMFQFINGSKLTPACEITRSIYFFGPSSFTGQKSCCMPYLQNTICLSDPVPVGKFDFKFRADGRYVEVINTAQKPSGSTTTRSIVRFTQYHKR